MCEQGSLARPSFWDTLSTRMVGAAPRGPSSPVVFSVLCSHLTSGKTEARVSRFAPRGPPAHLLCVPVRGFGCVELRPVLAPAMGLVTGLGEERGPRREEAPRTAGGRVSTEGQRARGPPDRRAGQLAARETQESPRGTNTAEKTRQVPAAGVAVGAEGGVSLEGSGVLQEMERAQCQVGVGQGP